MKFTFTSIKGEFIYLDSFDIEHYRGGFEFSTIYMKNGVIHYVTESFEYIDSILNIN